MQIVGRAFTHEQFKAYVNGLNISNWARFIVVHNTSEPDIALYQKWKTKPGWTPEQWLKNLVSYYSGLGWNGTPHLFIPPTEDQILVLNDLRVHGTHTPSWNRFSIGIETVGEFEQEKFEDPTHANLVSALTTLHQKLGLWPVPFVLGEKGLHFHKEDRATTHRTCPGRNMVKSQLVADVMTAMGQEPPVPVEEHHDVPIASQEANTAGMSVQELTSVKWLQMKLNEWAASEAAHAAGGFAPLTTDGVRGPKTTTAVRTFQKANGLVADGVAGPVTRLALKKLTT